MLATADFQSSNIMCQNRSRYASENRNERGFQAQDWATVSTRMNSKSRLPTAAGESPANFTSGIGLYNRPPTPGSEQWGKAFAGWPNSPRSKSCGLIGSGYDLPAQQAICQNIQRSLSESGPIRAARFFTNQPTAFSDPA